MKALLISFLFLGLLSCTGGKSDNNSQDNFYEDDLVKIYNEILSSDVFYSDTCDKDQKDKILEMMSALQLRKDQIINYENSYIEESYKKDEELKFGQISLYNNLLVPQQKDIWTESDVDSLYDIFDLYSKVKNEPVNYDWVRLNRRVRSRVNDDYKRVVMGYNFSLSYDDDRKIKSVLSTIEECENSHECNSLDLSIADRLWINKKRFYPYLYKLVNNSNEDFRKNLNSLKKSLSLDYNQRYEFSKRNHEIDKDNSTIIVRADLSIFAPDEQKMADLLGETWSKYGLKVKVLTQKDGRFDYYRFIHSTTEQRAYVHHGRSVLVFSNHMGIKTIFHEFGHVLGLRDKYFTIWDEPKCSYFDKSNNGDIMSIGSTGSILPRHIDQIKEIYFQ